MPKRDRGRKTLWIDRTIKAFGIDPSNRLVRVREEKVLEALEEAKKYIQRLSDQDQLELQSRCEKIEEDRVAAMRLDNNKKKRDALDPVKDAARQLAKKSQTIYTSRQKAVTAKTEKEWQETKEYLDQFEKRCNLPEFVKFYRQKLKVVKEQIDNLMSIESIADLQIATDGIYKIDGTGVLFELSEEIYTTIAKEESYIIPAREKINSALKGVQIILDSYKFDILTDAESKIEAVVQARDEVEKIDPLEKGSTQERINAYEIKSEALKKVDLRPLATLRADYQDIMLGVPGLLEGLKAALEKLPNENPLKAGLLEEFSKLDKQEGELIESKDLNELNLKTAAIKEAADTLMNDIIAASGLETVNEIYSAAISSRFGINLTIGDNAIFNLKKTYEMLSLVPESHTVHKSLSYIEFESPDPDVEIDQLKPSASYNVMFKGVAIASFPDESTMAYTDPVTGEPVDVNAFNVCMLHEIGHAVDDKNKIMSGLMEKARYGNWKSESKSSVETVFKEAVMHELRKANIGDSEGLENKVKTTINIALGGTEAGRPEDIENEQWNIIKVYADKAYKITVIEGDQAHWKLQPGDIRIGDRVYIQSYANDWHSYDFNEHAGNTVRGYQWRAPGEWFAEIYAYCWLYKAAPPAGVGDAINKWLPEVN